MSGWVTLEGVNGVGKSHLGRLASAALGVVCVPLVELPDSAPAGLPGQVVAALYAGGDRFLRTGHPATETLLLAALQVHRYESLPPVGAGRTVLEDRGPTSVAVYQAAVLAESKASTDGWALQQALEIERTIQAWRPVPTTTVLLTDDPAVCLARFEDRTGLPASADECALMARAGRIYHLLAADRPEQYLVLDRRTVGEADAVECIVEACRRAAAGEGAAS
ncbi:thymidylate kinase [Kitasatospora brasiliensis]|uniref:thymidylate kinase n=1 Tax=Kitasatospora brasiliensis TaxID=3058040 RepID=UPI00292CF89D|nr:thymidylate kinase [Kitasatospora sp. K002]